jgi:hypothetical protein
MAEQMFDFGPSEEEAIQAHQLAQQATATGFARMDPQSQGSYLGFRSGQHFGNALGGMFGAQAPGVQKAQALQAIQQQVDSLGIDIDQDPIGYAKASASALLKAGHRKEALKAIQWAQNMQKQKTDDRYKNALSGEAEGRATERERLLDEKEMEIKAKADSLYRKAGAAQLEAEARMLDAEARMSLVPEQKAKLKAEAEALRAKAKAALDSGGQSKGKWKHTLSDEILDVVQKYRTTGMEGLTKEEKNILLSWMNAQKAVKGEMYLDTTEKAP